MQPDAAVSSEATPVKRQLIHEALAPKGPASFTGILDRLFSLVFSGLVYPQIWEDPVVDLEAMKIEPGHHVVTIASGGCNVMSYLTAKPGRVTAVDLNRAHVALTRLKLAAISRLPSWEAFYTFFGEADERSNELVYRHYIERHLDASTRDYWNGRTLSGRRRISFFGNNLYERGLLGRFIGAGHCIARFYGIDLSEFLNAKSLEEQRQYFEREIAPLFSKQIVRWATARRVSLYGLGIPPAQYEALAASGNGTMADVLCERLERLACGFPLADNYFAWQAFSRAYAPGASGPLPPYLQYKNYPVIRPAAKSVEVRQVSVTAALGEMEPGSVDRVVLLDAQDWMNDQQLNDLWRAITRAAAPGARVIFRTAGVETILPGRVDETVLGNWTYARDPSKRLTARDRSAIYGGFHLYTLN